MADSPRRLNAADATFIHVGEATGMPVAPVLVMVLEGPFEPERLAYYRELLARVQPALRRRIAKDALSIALPRWVDVPGDDPADHWLHLPPPGDGTYRALLDWAERWALLPLEEGRSPWRTVCFDGVMVHGQPRTAIVQQSHHAMLDGEGSKILASLTRQWSADERMPALPTPEPFEEISPARRWLEGWSGELQQLGQLAQAGARRAARAVRAPRSTASRLGQVAASGRRLKEDLGTEPLSPLLGRRSNRVAFDHLEVDMPSLKAGAKAAGGTVNDGFMAAISLALRAWHHEHGVTVPAVRTSMAVSLREQGSTTLANEMIAVILHLPLDDDDTAALVRLCGEASRRHRSEGDGLQLMRYGREIGARMPDRVMTRATRRNMAGIDVQMSSFVGVPLPHWIAGREVLQSVGFPVGTLSGLAMVMTHRGTRTDLSVMTDPAGPGDRARLVACIEDGLRAVAALAEG